MSSDAVRAYVRDIVSNHPGQRQAKLTELATRLKTACGGYEGRGPAAPAIWTNWLDLQFVEGYLETGGAIYQDCIDNHERIERRIARNERKHHHG